LLLHLYLNTSCLFGASRKCLCISGHAFCFTTKDKNIVDCARVCVQVNCFKSEKFSVCYRCLKVHYRLGCLHYTFPTSITSLFLLNSLSFSFCRFSPIFTLPPTPPALLSNLLWSSLACLLLCWRQPMICHRQEVR